MTLFWFFSASPTLGIEPFTFGMSICETYAQIEHQQNIYNKDEGMLPKLYVEFFDRTIPVTCHFYEMAHIGFILDTWRSSCVTKLSRLGRPLVLIKGHLFSLSQTSKVWPYLSGSSQCLQIFGWVNPQSQINFRSPSEGSLVYNK